MTKFQIYGDNNSSMYDHDFFSDINFVKNYDNNPKTLLFILKKNNSLDMCTQIVRKPCVYQDM